MDGRKMHQKKKNRALNAAKGLLNKELNRKENIDQMLNIKENHENITKSWTNLQTFLTNLNAPEHIITRSCYYPYIQSKLSFSSISVL